MIIRRRGKESFCGCHKKPLKREGEEKKGVWEKA
jgi:hypothetical protein